MSTGSVETTRESIAAWFKAGIAAAGIGSNLIKKDLFAASS
jgi:2-keto-3-deoxy-6-phosphogluconate aldolase